MAIVKHTPPCSPVALQPCYRHAATCLVTTRTTTPIGGAPPPWRRRPLRWCTPVTSGDIRVIVVLATGLANMKGNTTPGWQC